MGFRLGRWDSEWEGRCLPAYFTERSRALLPVSHTSHWDILSYSELLHYLCSYRIIEEKGPLAIPNNINIHEPWSVTFQSNYTLCQPLLYQQVSLGLPMWSSDKEFAFQCRGCWFDPWLGN